MEIRKRPPALTVNGAFPFCNKDAVTPSDAAITLGVVSVSAEPSARHYFSAQLQDDRSCFNALLHDSIAQEAQAGDHLEVTCWSRVGMSFFVHRAVLSYGVSKLPSRPCTAVAGWSGFGCVSTRSSKTTVFEWGGISLRMLGGGADEEPFFKTLWSYIDGDRNTLLNPLLEVILAGDPIQAFHVLSYWHLPLVKHLLRRSSALATLFSTSLPTLRVPLPKNFDILKDFPELLGALRTLKEAFQAEEEGSAEPVMLLSAGKSEVLSKCLGRFDEPEDAEEAEDLYEQVLNRRMDIVEGLVKWLMSSKTAHYAINNAREKAAPRSVTLTDPTAEPSPVLARSPAPAASAPSDSSPAVQPAASSSDNDRPIAPLPGRFGCPSPSTAPFTIPQSFSTSPSEPIEPLKARNLVTQHIPAPALEGNSPFGSWKIVFSSRALRKMTAFGDLKKAKAIVKKLLDLSHGNFGGDNQKMLVGDHGEIPIYEAKILSDLRLIYQVDLDEDEDGVNATQILLIWGVETHQSLDKRIWAAIARKKGSRGPEYRKRCLRRRTAMLKGAKTSVVTEPERFPIVEDEEPDVELDDHRLNDQERLQIHDLLSLSKFVTMGKAVVKTILAQDEEGAQSHLFNTSPREREILAHESSSFVIGRSGTGKTTCILFKIIGLERVYRANSEGFAKRLRCVFLTQSPVLASKVKAYYLQLMTTAEAGNLPGAQLAKLVEERKAAEAKEDLEDLEDEATGLHGLPARFSELSDEHFPLFISFDTLLRLLEADYDIDWGGRTLATAGARRAFTRPKLEDVGGELEMELDEAVEEQTVDLLDVGAEATKGRLWERYIDSDVFHSMWNGFDQRQKKHLDPTLCWSEILGTIRGSEASVHTSKGYLSEEQYLNLSARSHSTYADLRPQVYSLFSAYLKAKGHNFDRSDRTHTLLKAMAQRGLPVAQQLDFVFVDEAQDLLLADCSLVQRLSTNPNAFLYAGDTAQTIAAGSAFTFKELGAAVYRLETKAAAEAGRDAVMPKQFSLSLNYRSHKGITNVAHSLVDAITNYFPDAIDRLEPEKGMVDGPKPVWILPRSSDGADDFTSNFLFGEDDNPSNFGAEQCILVRNEAARESLRKQTGDIGLILTIAESKGLEFGSILLYNFFVDSSADSNEWRILLGLIKGYPDGVPTFDAVRHAIIGQELRHLYVAVTRARNELWLADEGRSGEPIRQYLEYRNSVRTFGPEDTLPRMAKSSSPEAWGKLGRQMYGKKLYGRAAMCFEKANDELAAAVARAYEQRKEVRLLSRTAGVDARKAGFRRVCSLFSAAARVATGSQRVSLYKSAAGAALDAFEFLLAAQSFEAAEEYDQAAVRYLQVRHFDDASRLIATSNLSPSTREKTLRHCRLFFLRSKKLKQAQLLFETSEEAVDFMEAYGIDEARREWLLAGQQYRDVALMDLQEGDLRSASQYFRKAGDPESNTQALTCLVDLLSTTLPLGCSDSWAHPSASSTASLQVAADLLVEVSSILTTPSLDVTKETQKELDLYRCLVQKDIKSLRHLGFDRDQFQDPTSRLSALDAALSTLPTEFQGPQAVQSFIQDAQSYFDCVSQLFDRSSNIDLSRSKLWKLLGLQQPAEDDGSSAEKLRVLPTSPLFPLLPPLVGTAPSARLASVQSLSTLASSFLLRRLDDFVFECLDTLLNAPGPLQPPCFVHAFFRSCEDPHCERQHMVPSSLDANQLQDRLGLIGEVYRFARNFAFISERLGPAEETKRLTEERRCLTRLANALYPLHTFAGSCIDCLSDDSAQWSSVRALLASQARDNLFRCSNGDISVLSSFLRSSMLSLDLNLEAYCNFAAEPSVNRLSYSARPEYIMSRTDTIFSAITSLCASPPAVEIQSLRTQRAVDAIRHIIKKRIGVDAALLAYFMEDLASLATLRASRLPGNRGGGLDLTSWNTIVLPKSVMQRLLQRHRFRPLLIFSHGNVLNLMDAALNLLQEILFLSDASPASDVSRWLTFEGKPLSWHAGQVIATRILRIVSILARSRFDQGAVEVRIKNSLSSIRGVLGPASAGSLINPFFTARSVNEFYVASQRLPFDEYCQIDVSGGTMATAPLGVKILRGRSLDDIYRRLFPTLLSAKAAEFVPASMRQAQESHPVSTNVVEISEEEQTRQSEEDARALAVKTEREEKAACTIQKWSVKRLQVIRRRAAHLRHPFIALWLRYATAFPEDNSTAIYIRGPVVELAFALSSTSNRIAKAHKALKTGWSSADDEEAYSGRITEAAAIKQALIKLEKLLEPAAKHLKGATLLSLRGLIGTAPSVLSRAEAFFLAYRDRQDAKHSQQVTQCALIGIKGLLQPPKAKPVSTAPLRPIVGDNDVELDSDEEADLEEKGRQLAKRIG